MISEQSHDTIAPELGHIVLGNHAIHAHRPEHAGCDEECIGDRAQIVHDENGRKYHSVKNSIQIEQQRGGRRAQFIQHARDNENNGKLGDHQAEKDSPVSQHDRQYGRRRSHIQRRRAVTTRARNIRPYTLRITIDKTDVPVADL